jgi:hypothetical protein
MQNVKTIRKIVDLAASPLCLARRSFVTLSTSTHRENLSGFSLAKASRLIWSFLLKLCFLYDEFDFPTGYKPRLDVPVIFEIMGEIYRTTKVNERPLFSVPKKDIDIVKRICLIYKCPWKEPASTNFGVIVKRGTPSSPPKKKSKVELMSPGYVEVKSQNKIYEKRIAVLEAIVLRIPDLEEIVTDLQAKVAHLENQVSVLTANIEEARVQENFVAEQKEKEKDV